MFFAQNIKKKVRDDYQNSELTEILELCQPDVLVVTLLSHKSHNERLAGLDLNGESPCNHLQPFMQCCVLCL